MNQPTQPAVPVPGAGALAPREPWRKRFLALMVVVRQTLLPILVASTTVILFGRLGQAQEVLFGAIGVAAAPSSLPVATAAGPGVSAAAPPGAYIDTQYWALLATIAMLATAIWYVSRLLLTVDASTKTRLARLAVRRQASGVIEQFPRLLGAATAAGLVVTLLAAQAGTGNNALAIMAGALLLTLGPLVTVFWILAWHRSWRNKIHILIGAIGAWFLVDSSIVSLVRPAGRDWSVPSALGLACVLPGIFFILVALRRPLLQWLGQRRGKSVRPANAGVRFSLRHGLTRLLALGTAGGGILLLLGLGPLAAARALGSAAIVLLAVTALLCLLCAVTLLLRRLDHDRPGAVVTALGVLLALYVVGHAAFGWRPFREQFGEEILEPLPVTAAETQSATRRDVVVNAHGGGLRAALFTAQVLAELDDMSCGEFGRRIERLSGVSGGSLGIAVYLVLRQEFVAAGGWTDCATVRARGLRLTLKVDNVLLQDHLSAALARMLSVDLIPGVVPERGQALLDSWHQAVQAQMEADRLPARAGTVRSTGLAMPMGMLTGGLSPAPQVFFNATRVNDGAIVWLSNGAIRCPEKGLAAVATDITVGEAELHSARYPFVSPAGTFKVGGRVQTLIDGGYADNSGASALSHSQCGTAPRTWLNIDNYPQGGKRAATPRAAQAAGIFSGLDGLLAVRRSQAGFAVRRYAGTKGVVQVSLAPNLDEAFRAAIPDDERRTALVQSLRNAPLGWYVTPVTAGDQRQARLTQVKKACADLDLDCGY